MAVEAREAANGSAARAVFAFRYAVFTVADGVWGAVVVDGAGVLRSVVLSEAASNVGRGQVISGFVGRVG